ncbi:hypothetical protein D1007_25669 [Hordeum vulgare]|nr:hypothetical protein D1007_25669 [Hordeum vulgare]
MHRGASSICFRGAADEANRGAAEEANRGAGAPGDAGQILSAILLVYSFRRFHPAPSPSHVAAAHGYRPCPPSDSGSTTRSSLVGFDGPLRRSKRLNVIQVADQCDDDDGGCNNGEQFAPGHESEALDNEQGQDHNQVDKEVRKRKRTSLAIVWNMPKGQRIVVKCNENSQPIGDEGAILGKFLGMIARNGGFCPLNINDWRGVKKNSGEETILHCVQRQADPEKKRPHRSHVYLATHKKKDDANAENIDRNERLRIQCNGPVEARSSMQHDIYEDNNLPRLHEKAGDHDVNQLQIQENSSSPHDLVIDSVPEVREMRDPTGESFSRQNQQGTRTVHPHSARSRKSHTSTIKVKIR